MKNLNEMGKLETFIAIQTLGGLKEIRFCISSESPEVLAARALDNARFFVCQSGTHFLKSLRSFGRSVQLLQQFLAWTVVRLFLLCLRQVKSLRQPACMASESPEKPNAKLRGAEPASEAPPVERPS